MLRHQVREMEEAGLGDIDEERLKQEHAEAANAQRILELANGICLGLTGEEESAFNNLALIRSALGELSSLLPDAAGWDDEAEGIAIRIQELSDQITRRADRIEIAPERIEEVTWMLGGRDLTTVILDHAREMLENIAS